MSIKALEQSKLAHQSREVLNYLSRKMFSLFKAFCR
jgi:hypothetical protein